MKKVNLDIKMFKKSDKGFSQRKSVTIQPTETTTVAEIKNVAKGKLNYPFEIESEEFWYMDKQLKNDTDIVPNMSGNEYIITFK
jgi:hypothetical protein